MSSFVEKIAGSETVLDRPMPFTAHLDELRRRVVNASLILASGAVLVFYFSPRILNYLARPVGTLIFISPLEAFHVRLALAFAGGLILTLPLLLRETWLFLAPALGLEWRKIILRMLPLSYLLFIAGASLGVFVVIPATLKFLMTFGTADIKPMMTLGAYMGFVIKMALAFGAVFQMPLVFYALNRAGVVERKTFSSYRKSVYFLCFVAGAFLSPDVFAQFCIAIPSILLFEITILAMRR